MVTAAAISVRERERKMVTAAVISGRERESDGNCGGNLC
jgi:hypothetical protein